MGSAASKTARTAPLRKYPTRAAGASPAQAQTRAPRAPKATTQPRGSSSPASQAAQPSRPPRPREPEPQPEPVETENEDTGFASRLRQMGVVQPNPTYSPSSTAGPVQLPSTGSRPTGGAEIRGHDDDILRQIERHRQQYSQAAPSPSSPSAPPNATLSVLEARRRIQDQAAADGEDYSQNGREFLSALTLRDALVLRARGVDPAAIEARLQLKAGVVARLGPRGLVEALNVAQAVEETIAKAEKK